MEGTTKSEVERLLAHNQELLKEVLLEQNTLPYQPDMARLNLLFTNLIALCNLADQQPDTRYLLAQYREPLSTADLQRISFLQRYKEAVTGEYLLRMFEAAQATPKPPSMPKKPRAECKWTPEEEAKFLEGLERYGEKDLASIAEHIVTRTKVQVRSHLQKHKLRLARGRLS
jgi:SHAQKYF class myb-like DNA-binding protein